MAITYSPNVVRELNQRLVSLFDQGAGDAAKRMSPVLELCHTDTSDTAQNVYTLIDSDFQLRDRGDSAEMIIDGIKLYEAVINDGKKYKIIQVDLDKLEDDKVGQYKGIFYKLGMTQALGPTRLVEDTMLNATVLAPGGANKAPGNYDGVPLISDSHPVRPFDAGSPLWTNKLVRSSGLTWQTFGEAYALMESFPSEDGRRGGAGSKPAKLVTHSGNRQIANDICFGALPFDQPGGNPWKGEIEPMIVPFLASDPKFAFELIDNRSELERPYIYQERRALRLVPLFSSHEDAHVVKSRKLEYMVDGRLGAGFGYANKVVRVVTA